MRRDKPERSIAGAIGVVAGLGLLACDSPVGPFEVPGEYRLEAWESVFNGQPDIPLASILELALEEDGTVRGRAALVVESPNYPGFPISIAGPVDAHELGTAQRLVGTWEMADGGVAITFAPPDGIRFSDQVWSFHGSGLQLRMDLPTDHGHPWELTITLRRM
jgi:hypothetical protein